MTVEVVRKDIRNLHLGVYPPNGRVRVAAPLHMDDEAVRLAVLSRLSWIRTRQMSFEQQERQSPLEFVNGESHYLWGRRYRLRVVEAAGRPSVTIPTKTILELRVPIGSTVEEREAVLQRRYRKLLGEQIALLIPVWEPVVGVKVGDWRIRRMKTRWGSCSTEARRIWINLELAKKAPSCLEHVVVHEMVHLLERHHNDRFRKLMDQFMPHWRLQRDELKRAPLAHESWSY